MAEYHVPELRRETTLEKFCRGHCGSVNCPPPIERVDCVSCIFYDYSVLEDYVKRNEKRLKEVFDEHSK